MQNLSGKVAVVTGGVSGIGLGIAHALLSADMKVMVTYRRHVHLADALRSLAPYEERVKAVQVDVADESSLLRAADETERLFGKVHVLCNNAGVGVRATICDATYNDWQWAIAVNVMGVANGIRSFLPRIRAHGEGGHIVTTASMSGLAVPPVSGVYATTKSAAVAMMEALRGEIASQDIGVSVYCPGLVRTNLHETEDSRPEEYAESGRKLDPLTRQRLRDEVMAHGMDPLTAGEHVLEGIRRNDLYILSHPEFEGVIRERFDAILRSIGASREAPATRLCAEARTLSNPMYAAAGELSR